MQVRPPKDEKRRVSLLAACLVATLLVSGMNAAAAAPGNKGGGKGKPTTTTTSSTTTTTSTTSTTSTTTTTTSTTSTTALPSTSTVLLGVTTPRGPWSSAELDAFDAAAGKKAGLVMWYQGFAYGGFDRYAMEAAAGRSALPMITLEPWDYTKGVNQPEYKLSTITSGAHDPYLREWAAGAKQWQGRILVRFAHEMNGNWYPWSESVNGNVSGDYVAAWRHAHKIFAEVGATNVEWVWSPNVSYPGSVPMGALYPGDEYVDWVALDGYNWGTSQSWTKWQSFESVFGSSIDELNALAPTKPLLIAEVASAEQGGDKAVWITDMFASLANRPNVVGLTWFEHNKEADWRIVSSEQARAAFAQGVSDPRFGG